MHLETHLDDLVIGHDEIERKEPDCVQQVRAVSQSGIINRIGRINRTNIPLQPHSFGLFNLATSSLVTFSGERPPLGQRLWSAGVRSLCMLKINSTASLKEKTTHLKRKVSRMPSAGGPLAYSLAGLAPYVK